MPSVAQHVRSQADEILSALEIPPNTYRHEFAAEFRPALSPAGTQPIFPNI